MSVSVGIDLGTTFSAVAYVNPKTNRPVIIPNGEGAKITPSIIQFVDGIPVFGSEAESAFKAGMPGCATTFKRRMGESSNSEPFFYDGDKPYTAEDLSFLLLRHLKEDAETSLGETIDEAVITVPAYFYSLERESTLRAAERAGLKVKKIIDEPCAAAMAYGLDNWRENANILVYDLGGGTFDVTLVQMGKEGDLRAVTTDGDHILGGKDWDKDLELILIQKIEDITGTKIKKFSNDEVIVRGLCEGVKKKLSVQQEVNVSINLPDIGLVAVKVTRKEFESVTADLLERTGMLCHAVLNDVGMDPRDITDILLVGGSTRMPQISDYLLKEFGKQPIKHINPDEAVALGAAIQATKKNRNYCSLAIAEKEGKKITDRKAFLVSAPVKPIKKQVNLNVLSLNETTAHAMGVISISPDGTRYINDIIIPANHPRPVKAVKKFAYRTSSRKENNWDVFVLQGDNENPLRCEIPYHYVVSGIRHIPENKGKTTLRVQYTYDNNGIINVEARQEDDDVNLPIRRELVPEDMSKYGKPVEKVCAPKQRSIAIAVDTSGSMSGRPLRDAVNAICDFIKNFDMDYTRIGLITVADRSEVICPLTDNMQKLLKAARSFSCGPVGYGNEAHPFDSITRMLCDEEGALAIVMADGVWDDQNQAVAAARNCNNNHGIETIGLGFGCADKRFLKQISSIDEEGIYVSTSSELSTAFDTIAQSLGGSADIREPNMDSGTYTDTWE